ncbi:MAG: hypothetical protein WCI75_15635, partial [candidate division NC10 bacterium]
GEALTIFEELNRKHADTRFAKEAEQWIRCVRDEESRAKTDPEYKPLQGDSKAEQKWKALSGGRSLAQEANEVLENRLSEIEAVAPYNASGEKADLPSRPQASPSNDLHGEGGASPATGCRRMLVVGGLVCGAFVIMLGAGVLWRKRRRRRAVS